jgi:hydroxyacylglutathione hydrolase
VNRAAATKSVSLRSRRLKQIYPDLWQTAPEHPFGPGMSTHAYFLTRRTGNILFYNSGRSEEYDHIRQLGGVARQYLSHRDEAGAGLPQIKELFGSLLCCHRLEEPAIAAACRVDLAFDRRETHLEDIDVIPTPGHTAGSTCFLYESPHGKSYLFTGDTIFPDGDSWGTYVSGPQTLTLIHGLTTLRDLAPGVVLSSASTGRFAFRELLPGQWPVIIDRTIESLSRSVEE